ncbi:hypothetical protein BV22DRAFT_932494 [Leucogyrophana mollusca]|uniref:Uncharacterized protein n=1 Tax=Leucogyrophana mollusca TaxID=85980 RepID=A0ACB8AW88_9AGAM|nr:hypothetical protein BV22DRAFT_932494 [Leucogyrophana mollusca]
MQNIALDFYYFVVSRQLSLNVFVSVRPISVCLLVSNHSVVLRRSCYMLCNSLSSNYRLRTMSFISALSIRRHLVLGPPNVSVQATLSTFSICAFHTWWCWCYLVLGPLNASLKTQHISRVYVYLSDHCSCLSSHGTFACTAFRSVNITCSVLLCLAIGSMSLLEGLVLDVDNASNISADSRTNSSDGLSISVRISQ